MSAAHWSATENRVIEPYVRADSALDGVRFRYGPDEAFRDEAVTWFDRDAVPRPFAPEFFSASTCRTSPIGSVSLRVISRAAVVVRDRALKRWEALATWPLQEVPEQYLVAVPSRRFAVARRMEFAFLVTPRERLPERERRAHRPDQVVATRSFEAAVRRDGTRFNVATMPAKWFTDQRMPADTVWAIDWEKRTPDVEPIAALTVVVNERYAEKLQNAFGAEVASDALASQIAIDVFVEASLVAIENAIEYEPEGSTLLASVIAGLGIKDAEEFQDLKDKVTDDAGRVSAFSFVRARVQSKAGLGRLLGRAGSEKGR